MSSHLDDINKFVNSLTPEQFASIQKDLAAGRSFRLAAASAGAPLTTQNQSLASIDPNQLGTALGLAEPASTTTLASGSQVFTPQDTGLQSQLQQQGGAIPSAPTFPNFQDLFPQVGDPGVASGVIDFDKRNLPGDTTDFGTTTQAQTSTGIGTPTPDTTTGFGIDNPLGKPINTGGDPFVDPAGTGTSGGTFFTPDFRFDVDPNDKSSAAPFINALLGSLGPGIQSGEFTNFFEQFGATGNQNQQTAGDIFNQLSGGDPFTTLLRNQGANALTDPSGFNTPGIQGFLENELRSGISGGGISENFVNAARERILGPSNEALRGRLNRQGGGVADINSGLFQELERRQEADFNNDLQLFAGSNLNNLLGQAGQLGGQQFGQSFANLGFGAGAQGQLQGQLAQAGRDQGSLGLGQQGLALQGQGQRNEFGLTQQQIANQLVQTLLTGTPPGGFPTGALLGGLLNNSGDIFDIFKNIFGGGGNPNTGEGTNPNGTPELNPNEDKSPTGQTGGSGPSFDPSIIPGFIWDIIFNTPPGGFGTPNINDPFVFDAASGTIPGTFDDPFFQADPLLGDPNLFNLDNFFFNN